MKPEKTCIFRKGCALKILAFLLDRERKQRTDSERRDGREKKSRKRAGDKPRREMNRGGICVILVKAHSESCLRLVGAVMLQHYKPPAVSDSLNFEDDGFCRHPSNVALNPS